MTNKSKRHSPQPRLKNKGTALRKPPHKYAFYEAAVQTPEQHADMFALIYSDIQGRSAHILREDFCGTFLISCAWVKRDPKNKALSLDLDREPLKYGRTQHYSRLTPQQKRRLKILNQNVMTTTTPKADVIAACNFSFFIFKDRKTLVRYFKEAKTSLHEGGMLILEMAGGPGMIEPTKEQKTFDEKATGRFTYIWHQKSFNPITRDGLYAIHFKLGDGTMMKDAFTYDWRIWTIPEIRDALREAGYKTTHVYWEAEDDEAQIHEYKRTEKGDNAYSYITYVVAVR